MEWIILVPFIFLSIIALFYTIFYIVMEKQKKDSIIKRKKNIINLCKRYNYNYYDDISVIPETLKNFIFFEYFIHNVKYLNIISGEKDVNKFLIIDRMYTDISGRHKNVYIQSYCLIQDPEMNFPLFHLRDRVKFLDQVVKFIGAQDIKFEDLPAFSNQFVLTGEPEDLVRDYFQPNIRTTFLKNHKKGYSYEAFSDCFLVSNNKQETDVADLISLLNYSFRFYKELSTSIKGNYDYSQDGNDFQDYNNSQNGYNYQDGSNYPNQ